MKNTIMLLIAFCATSCTREVVSNTSNMNSQKVVKAIVYVKGFDSKRNTYFAEQFVKELKINAVPLGHSEIFEEQKELNDRLKTNDFDTVIKVDCKRNSSQLPNQNKYDYVLTIEKDGKQIYKSLIEDINFMPFQRFVKKGKEDGIF